MSRGKVANDRVRFPIPVVRENSQATLASVHLSGRCDVPSQIAVRAVTPDTAVILTICDRLFIRTSRARLSAPRERLSGYWRLAVPFPAGRGRHGEPGSGHLGTSFLQVHSGGMYEAYGLVSQRPFAVLDRHLLGTAKGLQTKGCSVGGERAPSHSCDRRRKEKSGQAHS